MEDDEFDGMLASAADLSPPLTFEQLCQKRCDGGLVENRDPRLKHRKQEIQREIATVLYIVNYHNLDADGSLPKKDSPHYKESVDRVFLNVSLAIGLGVSRLGGSTCTRLTKLVKEVYTQPSLRAVKMPGAQRSFHAIPSLPAAFHQLLILFALARRFHDRSLDYRGLRRALHE